MAGLFSIFLLLTNSDIWNLNYFDAGILATSKMAIT